MSFRSGTGRRTPMSMKAMFLNLTRLRSDSVMTPAIENGRGVSTLASRRLRALDHFAIALGMRAVKLIEGIHEVPSAGRVAKAGLRIPDEQPTFGAPLFLRKESLSVIIGEVHDAL